MCTQQADCIAYVFNGKLFCPYFFPFVLGLRAMLSILWGTEYYMIGLGVKWTNILKILDQSFT